MFPYFYCDRPSLISLIRTHFIVKLYYFYNNTISRVFHIISMKLKCKLSKQQNEKKIIYERGEIVSFNNKLINQSDYCDGITCSKTCASFLARKEQCSIRTSHSAIQTCASFSASSRQEVAQYCAIFRANRLAQENLRKFLAHVSPL